VSSRVSFLPESRGDPRSAHPRVYRGASLDRGALRAGPAEGSFGMLVALGAAPAGDAADVPGPAVLLTVVCSHPLSNPDDRPKGQAAIAGRGFAFALVL
jgi:hypothetical protein